MTRDAYMRMDVDTRLLYNQRVRRLQRAHPDEWPAFVIAYLALLGEAWHGRSRDVRLADAWPAALRVDYELCRSALRRVGLIDRAERIPVDAWQDWFGPASRRFKAGRDAAAMRWQCDGNAYNQPTRTTRTTRTTKTDKKPRVRARSRNQEQNAPTAVGEIVRRLAMKDD
jgi:hypothetical protein